MEVVCVVCERKEEEEEEETEKENSICCCYLDTDLIGPIWPKQKPQQKSEHNHYNTIKIHPDYCTPEQIRPSSGLYGVKWS